MTYPTVLSVVAIEAFVALPLFAAVRVGMPRLARPLVAGAGVSGAWGAWILVVVLRGPAWMMALTLSVIALSSVSMAIAIHIATREEEEHRGPGWGDPPSPDPDAPVGGGGDGEPLWWPDFARHLAAYTAEREHEPVEC